MNRLQQVMIGSCAMLAAALSSVALAHHGWTGYESDARKLSGVIVDRQARQLYRQPAAAIDRPVQGNAAPGAARGDRFGDAAFGIEVQRLGDLAPRPSEISGGMGADQADEFVRAEREAAVSIHLPHEAQGLMARSGRLVEPWRYRGGSGGNRCGFRQRRRGFNCRSRLGGRIGEFLHQRKFGRRFA